MGAAVAFEGLGVVGEKGEGEEIPAWRRAHEELVAIARQRAGLDADEGRWHHGMLGPLAETEMLGRQNAEGELSRPTGECSVPVSSSIDSLFRGRYGSAPVRLQGCLRSCASGPRPAKAEPRARFKALRPHPGL